MTGARASLGPRALFDVAKAVASGRGRLSERLNALTVDVEEYFTSRIIGV